MFAYQLLPSKNHARRTAQILAALVLLIAALVLLGWYRDLPGLAKWLSRSGPMVPNAAIGLSLAATGVILGQFSRPWRIAGMVLNGLAALLGLVQVRHELFGSSYQIDFLFPSLSKGVPPQTEPISMSGVSAMSLLLIGLASPFSNTRSKLFGFASQLFVAVVLFASMHALFGYAYDMKSFYQWGGATPIPFSSSVAFILLSLACLYASADRGVGRVLADPGPSGTLLRQMLPALLLTPLFLGWVAHAGRRMGFLTDDAVSGIIATGSVALMLLFLAWTVWSLRKSEERLSVAIEIVVENERLFRSSFENAFVGMAHIDGEYRWLRVNSRLRDSLGYTEQEFLGRGLKDLVHPDHLAKFERHLQALREGRTDVHAGYARWITRAGDVRWFDLHITQQRTKAGAFKHFILVMEDVTLDRRAKEQLRIQSRSLEAAGTGIIITDARRPDHPIVYVNSAFERLTGYSREEVLGKNARFLNRLDREQAALEELRTAIAAAQPQLVVVQNFTKDGTPFWNELKISPVFDDDSVLTHYLGIQNDITDRRRLAEELEDSLANALEERSHAVEAARARDVLLATVSHELRSPLNSIRLWASLLAGEARPDRAMLQRALEQIEASVETQSRLINDLLDVSRVVSGKLELGLEPVDLCALVKEISVEFRPAAQAKSIDWKLDSPASGAIVSLDRLRVKQAVRNLVENALKFTPEGGTIEVVVRHAGAEVELRVSDTGAGIAPEDLPHIFEEFWQAERGVSRRHGGLGLGLSIVKLVIERHGGRVTAHSEGAGLGATFVVRLPLATDAGDGEKRVDKLPAGFEPVDADVLVVDDETYTVEALALGLRVRGMTVRAAYDAESALASIAQRRPNVIVSDLSMPGMSGLEMLRKIRENEWEAQLPPILAIAISGRGSPSDRWRARRAGFDSYMLKPVRIQTVHEWIQNEHARPPVSNREERSRVLVLAKADALDLQVRSQGHEVASVRTLPELPRAAEKFDAQVLVIDLDDVQGDVDSVVNALRESRPRLIVIGLIQASSREFDEEVFDVVLEKRADGAILERALQRTRRTRAP